MSYGQLEPRVAALISSGRIPARIDSQQRTLFRVSEDSRSAMVQRVLSLTQVHTAAVKRDILRLSLLKHGFAVEAADSDGSQPSGRSRGPGRRVGSGSAAEQEEDGAPASEWTNTITNVFSFMGGGSSASSSSQHRGAMEDSGYEQEATGRAAMDYEEDDDDREDAEDNEDFA